MRQHRLDKVPADHTFSVFRCRSKAPLAAAAASWNVQSAANCASEECAPYYWCSTIRASSSKQERTLQILQDTLGMVTLERIN